MKTIALTVLAAVSLGLISPTAFGQAAAPAAPATDAFTLPATDDNLAGAGPLRRYGWFQNLWRNKRSAWAKAVEQDQGALVFLGDSITQGWGDDFGGTFEGIKTANRGISGDTTRGMLLRLDEDVIALNPQGVVMLMGTNDLEEKANAEQVAINVDLILAALKKHDPKLPVVLCRVFPSSAEKDRPVDQIKGINAAVDKVAKGYQQVTVLDTWTLYANKEGNATPANFRDLLHLNGPGYAKWAAALKPVLATLGFTETEADDFTSEEGFVSLFNGKDLTGWGYRPMPGPQRKPNPNQKKKPRKPNPNAPKKVIITEAVAFDGKTESSDGRYHAINGRLVVTTPVEGRRIQQIWTTEEFGGDFILKLEFRATPNADSGIFIRQPQLQCRDFPLAGPYYDLKSYKPQDWNEVVIKVTGGVAHCTCNGEVLEAEFKVPETAGPIGLEGDRGQMEYRRIRLKKLP